MKASPKDFFLYVLSNIALYYCAGWLVSLLYDYINYGFGTISYYETGWLPSSMRWAMASLVIVFPVYIWITRILNRDLAANPEKKDLWIRKWMMYLTLALSSIAIVIDLVALVNEFLSGEFATTFFLKILAVAVVSVLVFGYYFYELRRDAGKKAPQRSLFRWLAIVLVLVSIIGGFLIVGSPATARLRQYDQQRLTDLQNIQWQIVSGYWQKKASLPGTLADLSDPISSYMVPRDPQVSEGNPDYEYRTTGTRSFELCATFKTTFVDTGANQTAPIGRGPEFWSHGASRTCFTRSIDSQLYPVKPTY